MNCDQVFDRLTRGPFPAGDVDDHLVEQHLTTCHGCRQLAEALRPAVELMHESLEMDHQLPGYHGTLPPDGNPRLTAAVMSVINRQSSTVGKSQPVPLPRSATGTWQLLLAPVLLIVLLSAAMWTGRPAPFHPPTAHKPLPMQPSARGVQTLVAMNLPVICLGEESLFSERPVAPSPASERPTIDAPAGESNALNDMTPFACCTSCHTVDSNLIRFHAISKLTRSCELCHPK